MKVQSYKTIIILAVILALIIFLTLILRGDDSQPQQASEQNSPTSSDSSDNGRDESQESAPSINSTPTNTQTDDQGEDCYFSRGIAPTDDSPCAKIYLYSRELDALNDRYRPKLIAYYKDYVQNITVATPLDERTAQIESLLEKHGLASYEATVKALRRKYQIPSDDYSRTWWFSDLPEAFVEEKELMKSALGIDIYLHKLAVLNDKHKLPEFLSKLDGIDSSMVGLPDNLDGLEEYIEAVEPLIRQYGYEEYTKARRSLKAQYEHQLENYLRLIANDIKIKHRVYEALVQGGNEREHTEINDPFGFFNRQTVFDFFPDQPVYEELERRGIFLEQP